MPAGNHITNTGIEIISVSVQHVHAGLHIKPVGIEIILASVQNVPAGKQIMLMSM